MKYEKLISIRKLKGYTQEQLAESIAMEQTTLSRKERGQSPITDDEWQRIAAVLQVSVEEIKETLLEDLHNNVTKMNSEENQYVTIPRIVLDNLLKSKDEQIELLKEMLKNK